MVLLQNVEKSVRHVERCIIIIINHKCCIDLIACNLCMLLIYILTMICHLEINNVGEGPRGERHGYWKLQKM